MSSSSVQRRALVRPAALAAAVLVAAPLAAAVRLTTDEALALAFPGCEVERRTVFLDPARRAAAREAAGVEVTSAIVHPYEATCGGERAGTAYFDAHRVRTLPETLMVVVGPAGEVHRVEVLSFDEPPDYLPRQAWYRQFEGHALDRDLALGRGIRGVTGATLTARATAAAVRRVLALHRVLYGPGGSTKGDGGTP